jgi:hypothetical protein
VDYGTQFTPILPCITAVNEHLHVRLSERWAQIETASENGVVNGGWA